MRIIKIDKPDYIILDCPTIILNPKGYVMVDNGTRLYFDTIDGHNTRILFPHKIFVMRNPQVANLPIGFIKL